MSARMLEPAACACDAGVIVCVMFCVWGLLFGAC